MMWDADQPIATDGDASCVRPCSPGVAGAFLQVLPSRLHALAQLFACLVVREFFGLSYRRTEALLTDSPQWLADVGLDKAPDHNTLWRARDNLTATDRPGSTVLANRKTVKRPFGR